jgi:pimeloyl-ACP methyl ester carboxylesterase
MPKLHALLIAINEYHPASRVSKLDGCVNDLNAMKDFLKANYEQLTPDIKTLTNNMATREGIIKAFESHLIKKAKAGDTVLLFYAGHGSYAKTAEAFVQFDPKAQDETMVCYDSRLPGKHDLADKELAVLLSRIAAGVHIVVIVDACHSASITRSAVEAQQVGKTRFTPGRANEGSRDLQSYLLEGDQFYAAMWKEKKQVSIPRSKHLLLSACDRDQLASETDDRRGLFTTTLLAVLAENKDISYSDLFYRVRQRIQSKNKQQKPTFYSLEGFDPNVVFLLKDIRKSNKRHPVRFTDGAWRLAYGAIHGLPTEKSEVDKLQIGIYGESGGANENVLLQTVKVDKVLLKESILSFVESDKEQSFKGEILSFPAALLVGLKGDAAALKNFQTLYKSRPSPFLLLDEKAVDAKYTLEVVKDKMLISLTADNSLIHGVEGLTEPTVKYIIAILEQMESWERLANLQNANTTLTNGVEVLFLDETDPAKKVETKDTTITFDYPKRGEDKDENGDPIPLFYTIKARNNSDKKLNVALLHLNAGFGISTFFACAEIAPKSEWLVLDDAHGLYIEKEEWSEVTDIFKVIVSTEPFDDYQFQKSSFDRGLIAKEASLPTRGAITRNKPESDWCTHTITVNTIRKEQTISNKDITFDKEKISIKAHPSFKADVAFAPAKAGTRSVHPVAALSDIFNDASFGLLNLAGGSRSVQDKTIIELSGITNEEVLKNNPLEIQVNHALAENESLMPVTFDGEFVLPFGQVTKQNDGTVSIKIDELPLSEDVNRKRSVGKAIWFCLLKVTGFREKAFRLQLAQLNRDGELVRNRNGLNSKVAEANKILIIIHGIIGDTSSVAKNLMHLVDPKDDQKYDLMLTFDYENLNEPIEKIATEFNNRLTELDLKPGDGKQIDIVAHSMGGLVSRYLIETIRKGDGLIHRLVMLGTPNGGSPLGSLPEYINIFRTLTTLAINFSKPFLTPILVYLEALEKVNRFLKTGGFILVTLDQMNAESDFVKALFKNNKPSTDYVIIAGDITQYTPLGDSNFSRFIDKVLVKIGDGINHKLPNDIAVSVDQILDVPPSFNAVKFTVVGHHLNYFEEGMEARRVLEEALK